MLPAGKGRRRGGAERVDQALHQHGANGADALLDRSGDSKPEDRAQDSKVHSEILEAQAEQRNADIGVDNAQYDRYRLRLHSGNGNAPDSHSELDHIDEVQDNIEDRGDNQEIERSFRVAHTPEHRGIEVIQEHEDQAFEDLVQIGLGIGNDLRRSIHQLQNGTGGKVTDHTGDDHQDHQRNDRSGKGGAHPFMFSGAEQLGDNDLHTHGDTDQH